MLLVRSASTPVLGSLVSSLHHCGTLRETEYEGEQEHLSRTSSCNFSYSGAGSALFPPRSPADSCHFVQPDDVCSVEDWDFDRELVPWPRFRRAQSENDLQSLVRHGKSPATITADKFSRNAKAKGDRQFSCEAENLSGAQKQWSRRLCLRRCSSLSVIYSEDPPVDDVFADGIVSSFSRGMFDVKEEDSGDSPTRPGYMQAGGGGSTLSSLNAKAKLEGGAHEISALQQRPFATDFRPAREAPVDVVPQPDDDADAHTRSLGPEVASVSGRETECVFMVNDEVFSSTAVSSSGLLVCNSKGCRPLQEGEEAQPMFIAGGLGIGGGSGGGGGGGGGVAGGGGSFGWGGFGTETDAYYKRMLELHPGNALLLRNYARFLHEVMKDLVKAEEYFERAILASPADGELLAMYGKLIWDKQRDQERAGNYFDRAIQVAPDDSYVLAAYASFLWKSEGDEEDQIPADPDEQSTQVHSMRPYGSATRAF